MLARYLIVASFFLFLYSCGDSNSGNTSQETQSFALKFQVKANGQPVGLGKYYLLKGADSILFSRLDFYVQHTTLLPKSGSSFDMDTVMLYSFSNTENTVYKKSTSIPLNIDTVKFLLGLDEMTNSGDPNRFEQSHPLSSWKNMHWTWSSGYRFAVFEAKIKKADGTEIPVSYHPGLIYRNFSINPITIVVNPNTPKTYNAVLNVEKIFFPSIAANEIKYAQGETQAHADPSDIELTDKFAKNFAAAFTVE